MKPIVYIVLVADSFRSDAAYQIEGVFASLEAVESFVTTELEGVADYIVEAREVSDSKGEDQSG